MPAWDRTKHPDDVDWRYFVFCDKDGTNDGSAPDDGLLQGETISTIVGITFSPTGELSSGASNSGAITIDGVSYAVNTVVGVRLEGGVHGTIYKVTCEVTTSGGRTLKRSADQLVVNR